MLIEVRDALCGCKRFYEDGMAALCDAWQGIFTAMQKRPGESDAWRGIFTAVQKRPGENTALLFISF